MSTTLDIEANVLGAAKKLARHRGVSKGRVKEAWSVGKIISDLARQALTGSNDKQQKSGNTASITGFNPFPTRGSVVTNGLIDRLPDAEDVWCVPCCTWLLAGLKHRGVVNKKYLLGLAAKLAAVLSRLTAGQAPRPKTVSNATTKHLLIFL